MKRKTVSLCLIVKNEVENLMPLLKSVEGCFDEICITDTGSTDGTIELATAMGCKVSHFEWCDDFAAARNFNFEQATSDYVAWIDADDCLSDKEAFKLWRDTIMQLGDYHLANYYYAYDFENKVSRCTFPRERVVKRSLGLKWRYFVHEGIMAEKDGKPIQVQFCNSWQVIHRRTDIDMKKDRSRNINIFKVNMEKAQLDSRMQYYYAKELFENDQPNEAIKELAKAFEKPDLAPHDRVLCLQFLAYSYMRVDNFQKALEIAHAGLLLDSNRAEFHVVCGDALAKMNNTNGSLPFYYAAKNCQPNSTPGSQLIFSTADAYTYYPRNQIATILANQQKVDEALSEARECMALFGHPDTKLIIDRLEEFKKANEAVFHDALDCDEIVMTCLQSPYEWDGAIYKVRAMGGSETAAIEMAQWLSKLSGKKTTIFNSVSQARVINGVNYRPIAEAKEYFRVHKPWFHIAWRHNTKLTNARTWVYCHDVQTMGLDQHQNYQYATALTPFHANMMMATQSVPKGKVFLTRNGVVPERFKDIDLNKKDPFSFALCSSPDRGLERTIQVLKKVRETYPEVTLAVGYGIEHLDQYGHKELRLRLEALFEDNKEWLTYHGKMEQRQLMELYKRTAYNVQPSNWMETSCISALELIYCGVYPIFREIAGVADTLRPFAEKGMASLVDSDCITHDEYLIYIDEVLTAIQEQRYLRVKANAEDNSWEKVAIDWLDKLNKTG